jgi:hypothetical protein
LRKPEKLGKRLTRFSAGKEGHSMPATNVKGQVYVGRRGLFSRTQYFGRILSTRNGKTLMVTSEGYNNRNDCADALDICSPDIPIEHLDSRGYAIGGGVRP